MHEKKIKILYLLFVIVSIFFVIQDAFDISEKTINIAYGTSRDDAIELNEDTNLSCTFISEYDNLRGISVKFQSEARFNTEKVHAILHNASTGEIINDTTVELKYERIQNKDGGSNIYFSLPADGVKNQKLKVSFSFQRNNTSTYPKFILSDNRVNESELWIDGEKSDKDLVFFAQYSTGISRNVAGALAKGLLWFAIGTLIYIFALSERKNKDTELDVAEIPKSTNRYKIFLLKEFINRRKKICGYILMVFFLLFLMLYVYQYGVEVPMIDKKIGELKYMYLILCILLLGTGTIGYYSVVVKKMSTERIFIAIALPLGIIFGLVIGLNTVPDEPSHIDTAYALSNELLGIPESAKPGYIYKRAEDVDTYAEDKQKLNAESYKYLYKEIFSMSKDDTLVEVAVRSNLGNAGKIYYLPQALGIVSGRMLGFGMMPTMLLGRLFSLLLYICLIYIAIKIIPFAKTTVLIVAILPISLQQAASFSYDAAINAVAFLYTAFCMKGAYGEDKISCLDVGSIAITGSLLCSVKGGVYVSLFLLPVILLRKGAYSKKLKWTSIALTSILLFSFVITNLARTISRFSAEAGTVIGGAASTEIYTFGYFLQHPQRFLGMFVNTFYKQGDSYIRNLFGGNLAWRDINISWFIVIGFIIIVLLSCIYNEKEVKISSFHRILLGIIALGAFFCVEVSMLFVWTPKTINYITGVQGRYFIPFFILILLAMRTSFFEIKRNINKGLILTAGMLNIITILQVVQRALER